LDGNSSGKGFGYGAVYKTVVGRGVIYSGAFCSASIGRIDVMLSEVNWRIGGGLLANCCGYEGTNNFGKVTEGPKLAN
jgi:hypothetical protein